MQQDGDEKAFDVDSIIERLLEVRGAKPGKSVVLTEAEVIGLCLKSRDIFMSQPVLLELEAPLKICGKLGLTKATSTASTTTSCVSSSTASSLRTPTTFSSATTSTAASTTSRPSACCSPTRSSTPRTSSCYAATTRVRLSTASTASTMNANGGTTSSSGRCSPSASTACQSPPSSTIRSSACTAASVPSS